MAKNIIPQTFDERLTLVVAVVTQFPVTLSTADVVKLLDRVGCDWSHATVLRVLEEAANRELIGFCALSAKEWGWYGLGWSYGGGNL